MPRTLKGFSTMSTMTMSNGVSESNGIIGEIIGDIVADETVMSVSIESAPEIIESEDTVISKADTWDSLFKSDDPLLDKYRRLGQIMKDATDPLSKLVKYLECGMLCVDIHISEYNLNPSNYARKDVMPKLVNACRLSGVPASLNKPNEFIRIYELWQLIESKPGAAGETRVKFHPTMDNAPDFAIGQLTHGACRELIVCLENLTKDGKELDVWEFKAGWEERVRSWVKRLQDGSLSIVSLKAVIAYQEKVMDNAYLDGLSPIDLQDEMFRRESDATDKAKKKAISLAKGLRKHMIDVLNWTPIRAREMLIECAVIPRDSVPGSGQIPAIATNMTPGDAKALVQALASLTGAKPDRQIILDVLTKEINAIKSTAVAKSA